MEQKTPAKTNPVFLLSAGAVAVFAVNLLFLTLTQSEAKSVALVKEELVTLRQQEKIVSQSQAIFTQYEGAIRRISSVFPDEATIPLFIQTLEEKIREISGEYSFKFNSVTPVPEGERLYLPFTVILKTDLARLSVFLDYLEKSRYLTHITFIASRVPNGFTQEGEVTLSLKVYVQNPFTGN